VERTQTRLQRFIDELGLKAKDITDEASRISMQYRQMGASERFLCGEAVDHLDCVRWRFAER